MLSSQGRPSHGSSSTAPSARESPRGWSTTLTSSPSSRPSRASSRRSRTRCNWRPPRPPHPPRQQPITACPTCCPLMDPLVPMLPSRMLRWMSEPELEIGGISVLSVLLWKIIDLLYLHSFKLSSAGNQCHAVLCCQGPLPGAHSPS